MADLTEIVQSIEDTSNNDRVHKIYSVFDPRFADLVEGQSVELVEYHPDSGVGGGSGVVRSARHNGGTAISLPRTRPTDWSDRAQLADWFADSGSDELCFIRLDYVYSSDIFGIKLDGSDETEGLKTFALNSSSENVKFSCGSTIVTEEINFTAPSSIDFSEMSVAFDTSDTSNPITVGRDEVVEKHELVTGINKGVTSLTLDDVTDINVGSMISIHDPADYSYSGWRPDYKKGEYMFVSDITGNTVTFAGASIDSYDAGSKVYLIATTKCPITGSLSVTNTGAYSTSFGLRAWGVIDSDMTNLDVRLYNGTHCLSFSRAVNCSGANMVAIQSSGQLSNREYGLAQGNCQNNKFHGRFHAERHGSTVGGSGGAGNAINRFLEITGRITTTGLGGVHAADFHGNTENCSYGGYLEGVTSGGHDTTIIEASYVISPIDNLAPLTYSELKSTKHTAKHVTVVARGNSGARGAIDAGGNSSVISEHTTEGGNFDFTGSYITSPVGDALVTIRNRGATGIDYGIILHDIVYEAPSAVTGLACVPLSGDDVNFVSFNNDLWGVGVSSTASDIRGILEKGVSTFATTNTSNYVTVTIPLTTAFPTLRYPRVSLSLDQGTLGGVPLAVSTYSSDEENFSAHLYTIDGSNFVSVQNIDFRWLAEAMPR